MTRGTVPRIHRPLRLEHQHQIFVSPSRAVAHCFHCLCFARSNTYASLRLLAVFLCKAILPVPPNIYIVPSNEMHLKPHGIIPSGRGDWRQVTPRFALVSGCRDQCHGRNAQQQKYLLTEWELTPALYTRMARHFELPRGVNLYKPLERYWGH